MTAARDIRPNPFDPIIGLEVHAQVLTASKMFCSCSAAYFGAAPNSHVCAVCGGMPGALPVMNRKAVESTILTGLALGCSIAARFKFDRKNYQYPDLPKGYQITQYDRPIAVDGCLEFLCEGRTISCGITRVHLEEDTGKSTHTGGDAGVSLIDYNRCGVPLMEIVGEPDLRSALAAREYFAALRQTLMYLGVCDGNLQEGSMRADVNISLTHADGAWGTKVELKNLNSFRAVQRAIEFEIARQRRTLESGGEIIQETRGWNEQTESTVPQRTKEYAHDYRYFPEPDLPPIETSADLIAFKHDRIPELPLARRSRLKEVYNLSAEMADTLTADRDLGDFFDGVILAAPNMEPSLAANWITQELLGLLNEAGGSVASSRIVPSAMAGLLMLLAEGTINGPTAKEVLPEMLSTGEPARAIVERRGLSQVSDEESIHGWVESAIASNPRAVQDFLKGKEKAAESLIGRVMGASRGKANIGLVRRMMLEALERQR